MSLILFNLFLPLFNFLTFRLLGFILGIKGIFLFFFISSIVQIFAIVRLILLILNNDLFILLNFFSWLNIEYILLSFEFLADGLSVFMCLLVLTVSTIVHYYSFYYMEDDNQVIKFISYLSLFTFFMLILVVSTNLIQFFLGWEGVGLCSFLLISFWQKRPEAKKAALKAVLINRIGDSSFLFFIALFFFLTHSLDFFLIFSLVPYFSLNFVFILELLFFFLIIAISAKSSQIGLHIWLFSAMEGPTPVSALIHAATMVTAGVYGLLRCGFLLLWVSITKILLIFLGLSTSIMAAAVALTQNDLKKVIAYSTCSQLGYMVVSCAISSFKPAFFHLFTHGFFKALLFLSAGLLIHSLNQEQDIRRMGGLLLQKPITYIFFLIGSLALVGFPSLSGYYSKDSILDQLALYLKGGFLINLACLALVFTSSYSYKVLYLVFITKPQGFKKTYLLLSNQNEAPFYVLFLLSFLYLFSIFSGYCVQDLFFGIGNFFFNFSLVNSIDLSILTESLVYKNKSFPLICIFISIIFIYICICTNGFQRWNFVLSKFSKLYNFIHQDLYINYILLAIGKKILKISKFFFYNEKLWLEFFGPSGSIILSDKLIFVLNWININRSYLFYINFYTFIFFVIFFLSIQIFFLF